MPLLLIALACARHEHGADEPIRVEDGTFHEGPLPEDVSAESPRVTEAASTGAVITSSQGDVTYAGLTTPEAWSVAFAVDGVGTGFWTVPTLGPDVTANGELLFTFVASFGPEVPFGLQAVRFTALDEAGAPGPATNATLCVLPDWAGTNLSACDPAVPPLSTVLSLRWDTDVDLDLVVVAPNGKIVRGKTPTTALPEGASVPNPAVSDPTTGRLSRDSNAGCQIDAIRTESLVFTGEPPPGTYRIYASLAYHCGRSSVLFDASAYVSEAQDDGTWSVTETALGGGQLLALQADGGTSLGLHVADFVIP